MGARGLVFAFGKVDGSCQASANRSRRGEYEVVTIPQRNAHLEELPSNASRAPVIVVAAGLLKHRPPHAAHDGDACDPCAKISELRSPASLALLAECSYLSLQQIVTGRMTQCAFPDSEHECQQDDFSDVFSMWTTGQLSPQEPPVSLEDEDELEPE